jgi:hypothetical protein
VALVDDVDVSGTIGHDGDRRREPTGARMVTPRIEVGAVRADSRIRAFPLAATYGIRRR